MNQTNFEHAGYAFLMMLPIGLLTGNWWAGAALAIGFFLGREHAQQEYKLGTTGKSPWPAFDIRLWSRDAQLDLLFPVAAVVLVASLLA